jgi:glutamate carboxypeptidase
MIAAGRALAAAVLLLGAASIAPAAEANKPLLDSAERQQPGAIKLWERLVNIDSGTGDMEGVNAVGAVAVEELKKLGAAIEMVPALPAFGDNIVASLSGSGKGKILLIAHMDTVFKKGDAAARPCRIEGGRAYGPGVSDDKAGIVVALSVLKILDDLKFKDYARLTLMLNTNEETGSRGSRALIEKLAREHDVTLNLESGRVGDGITIWRKGSGTINVEVEGRASHAGGAPELGRCSSLLNLPTRTGARPSTSRSSSPATARTSFQITRWRMPISEPWFRRSSTGSSESCR